MKTLILGATTNEARYANIATKRLLKHGYEIILLGNKKGEIEGHPIINDTANIIEEIDTVTLYLSERNQVNYEDFLLKLNPRRVIFNPGTENPALSQKLTKQGVEALNACTLVMLSTNQY